MWTFPTPLLRLPKFSLDNLILQKTYPVLLKHYELPRFIRLGLLSNSCSLVGFECQSLAGRNTSNFLFLGRDLVKLTVGGEQASLSAYLKVTCNSPPFLKAALSSMSKVMLPEDDAEVLGQSIQWLYTKDYNDIYRPRILVKKKRLAGRRPPPLQRRPR
jgi:hypothetical protein